MIRGYIILFGWLLLQLASLAMSAPVALAWDAVPAADSYRVWRGIDVLAVSTSTTATIDLPEGEGTTIRVTAINAAGESDPSAPITVYLPPGFVPAITPSTSVTLTIRSSVDLREWSDISVIHLAESAPKKFYQLSITTAP